VCVCFIYIYIHYKTAHHHFHFSAVGEISLCWMLDHEEPVLSQLRQLELQGAKFRFVFIHLKHIYV